jgi:hypothetical protein
MNTNASDLINAAGRFRVRIDSLIRGFHADERLQGTHGYHAVHSLLMAKGWVGKFKGHAGAESPYKEVSEIKDIPKTEDVSDQRVSTDTLEYLDALYTVRGYMGTLTDDLEKFQEVCLRRDRMPPRAMFCLDNAWMHLNEASMHMGFALSDLRNEYIDAEGEE